MSKIFEDQLRLYQYVPHFQHYLKNPYIILTMSGAWL